jgi:hypothetical protein
LIGARCATNYDGKLLDFPASGVALIAISGGSRIIGKRQARKKQKY